MLKRHHLHLSQSRKHSHADTQFPFVVHWLSSSWYIHRMSSSPLARNRNASVLYFRNKGLNTNSLIVYTKMLINLLSNWYESGRHRCTTEKDLSKSHSHTNSFGIAGVLRCPNTKRRMERSKWARFVMNLKLLFALYETGIYVNGSSPQTEWKPFSISNATYRCCLCTLRNAIFRFSIYTNW